MLSIVNGSVFDGVGPEPVECPVHTEGGRIVGLEGPPPDGARVVDAKVCVVTPGLIDAHVHASTVSMDLLENEASPTCSAPATSVNAAILRRPDLGVIREGIVADLVVLAGNPFERTDVLWSPQRLVIRSGRWWKHDPRRRPGLVRPTRTP